MRRERERERRDRFHARKHQKISFKGKNRESHLNCNTITHKKVHTHTHTHRPLSRTNIHTTAITHVRTHHTGGHTHMEHTNTYICSGHGGVAWIRGIVDAISSELIQLKETFQETPAKVLNTPIQPRKAVQTQVQRSTPVNRSQRKDGQEIQSA
jgi:hypothetical protein